ncbi:MAG: hypothetical protein E5V72_09425 [Mesorhizobium sp.]|uniref:hypothetical protein n=1 Tax=Mesorhizobium sp. TaxID=1871066 RepID=UPI000FE524BC|nr:hypothetical protein [Mesorhizobium sp.]RWD50548.1 MAG: hypothetical protein EOS59_09100 [Mesorhizobium sp.]RWE55761.1 MAG: hypothetical protein EOS24_23080 [Mesorhizobium sp.]RWF08422.1 MAG: hypothetical protein EOS69_24205 [Mesorhizobium sp.]RWF20943.1 MAG: hypothetical protein EOS25_06550 [Mesorhizobium sp.]TIW46902.1 MAG: hypothetical protein E5V71_04200 [Mesorhizobium sp.]
MIGKLKRREAMQIKISGTEESRIERAIQAAVSGSWEEFSRLTDAPFPNDESMKEQIDDSSRRLQQAGGNWKRGSGIEILADGVRFIITRIEAPPEVDIVLSLHSTSEHSDSTINIWTFHQQLNWED